MKIAYLKTSFLFGLKAGGSLTHMEGFADAITNLGNKLFFISPDKLPGINTTKTPIYLIKFRFPQKLLRIGGALAYNFRYFFRALKILKSEKPDFLYQRYTMFNFSGILLSNKLGTPIIIELNSFSALIAKNAGNFFLYPIARLIEKWVILKADKVVVVSNALRDALVDMGISSDKIILNPNGVNPQIFRPDICGDDIRIRYNIDKNKIVVGFVSTFTYWHGTLILMKVIERAVKENHQLHFFLIGKGDLFDVVKNIIRRKKLWEHVTLVGEVSHKEIPKYLATCEILVSPHIPIKGFKRFFGSPTKLFEYMAMGKGIVASNLGQIGEVLKHNHNALLTEPQNIEQIVRCILKLANDRDLRNRLGRQAREDIVRNYTWQRNAERVIAVAKSFGEKTE